MLGVGEEVGREVLPVEVELMCLTHDCQKW